MGTTPRPCTVAVTGATGIVGQFIVRKLIKEGVEVRAASSRPKSQSLNALSTERAQSSLRLASFDMTVAGEAERLLDGCDALVHCAFAHAPGRYRGGEGDDPQKFWTTNLGATQALLNACRVQGVARAIVLTSRAVFGTSAMPTVTEDSPKAPDTHYGALKRAEESLVRISAQQPNFDAACLRATGVYGALQNTEASKWFNYCEQVHRGEAISEVRAGTEVHGTDVADAIWRLLCAPQGTLGGEAFNCSDQWVSSRMIARCLNSLAAKNLELPPLVDAASVQGTMNCAPLRQLGWRPGGTTRLRETLAELLVLAQRAQPVP